VLVLKAGIVPERIEPGKPQQNGRLERLHLTLLQDTASPPARTLRQQCARLHVFQRIYNEERPHQALGNTPPGEQYSASPRRWDGVLRSPGYPEDHQTRPEDHETRRVRHSGEIKWRGNRIHINQALAGEPVGLAERDDGGWLVRYGPVELGVIDHRGDRLNRPKPKPRGLVDNPTGLPTTPPAQQQQQPT